MNSSHRIEARIVRISNKKTVIKVWNSGTAAAYDVDYEIPKEYGITAIKRVTPFEKLEPGKNFEEIVTIYYYSAKKYRVITSWRDENNEQHTNDCLEAR